jgi:iron complex outermembrane receptor protein
MRAGIIDRNNRESATHGLSAANRRSSRLLWSLLVCLWLCWPPDSSAQQDEPSPDDDVRIDPELIEESIEGARDPALEEIIVTAQGGKRALQEISVSVAAFDAEYLEALGAQSIADIAQFTPNLEIRSVFAASNPTLFIRGVGLRDFNANSSSSVAVYNDDVYMNSPAGQLAQLFDVQQIEVLRGPQGTLYGRNASAGAIRVIARKPTGDPGGYTRVKYGRFNEIEIEGAAEMSILPDVMSLRVAGKMNQRDGTTKNRCADDKYWRDSDKTEIPFNRQTDVFFKCFNGETTQPIEDGGLGWIAGPAPFRPAGAYPDASEAEEPPDIHRRVNDVDHWAARALLRIDPTPDMDWTLNVHGGQNRSQARQFQTIGRRVDAATNDFGAPREDADNYTDPDNVLGFTLLPPPNPFGRVEAVLAEFPEDGAPYQGDYNRTGPENLDLFGTSLTGEISFGDLQLRTITAYEWNDRFVAANVDANPYIGLELDLGNTAWQVSQEVRGYWDGGGGITVQGGVFFLHEDLEVDNKFRTSITTASYQDYQQETYAGSVYGFLTWEITESFTIEGGARWNIDHKTFDLTTGPGSGIPGSDANPDLLVSDSERVTKNAMTGDISLNYRPVDDLNIYLKYSRGWKGPHINGGALGLQNLSSGSSLITPVDPEKVDALEIGLKAMLFDDRVRLNAAGFYYDYEDIQIFQLKNAEGGIPVQELINANDADVYGVEIEFEARPLEGWAHEELEGLLVFMAFAWLDTQYTDFSNTKVNFIGGNPVPVTENLSGNTLINAPPYAFTGYVQWDLPIWGWGSLAPRFDWAFKDKVYFSPQNLEEVSQGSLWLMNARLAYTTPNDMIEVAGWVRNLTDEVYHADVINLSNFQQAILYIMGDPRTYGFSLTVRF